MAEKQIIGDRFKILLMSIRQCLIMLLGSLEDYLEIERSIIPRRKRSGKNNPEGKSI